MPTEDTRKQVLLKMDQEMHDHITDMAAHYGANVRSTILRYIRLGLAYDQEAIRRERDTVRRDGAGDA